MEITKFQIVFLIGMVLFVGICVGSVWMRNSEECDYECIQIPDRNMINGFCKDNGYKYGWLDSSCEINKVVCFRELGNAKYYDCLEYITPKAKGDTK